MKKTISTISFTLLIIIILFILSLIIFLTACTTNQPANNTEQQNNTIKECSSDSDCIKAGCSGQLCILKDKKESGFTTCEFKPEYECYSKQDCLCKNNKCGWSDDVGLNRCITEKSKITA